MKPDLRKYKDYTILYHVYETNSESFCPVATLFKSGEKPVTLAINRTYAERDQALSFALGAAEATIDAKLKGERPEFFCL